MSCHNHIGGQVLFMHAILILLVSLMGRHAECYNLTNCRAATQKRVMENGTLCSALCQHPACWDTVRRRRHGLLPREKQYSSCAESDDSEDGENNHLYLLPFCYITYTYNRSDMLHMTVDKPLTSFFTVDQSYDNLANIIICLTHIDNIH